MFSFDHYPPSCSVLEYFCEHIHEINSLKENFWAKFFKALCVLVDIICVCVLNRSVLSYFFLWPHGLQPTRVLCPWDSPGKNTVVGCHFFLHGIFPTLGSNVHLLCLLHWQAGSLPLCHLGSPDVTNTLHLGRYWPSASLGTVTCFIAFSPVNKSELCWLKHTRLGPLVQFIARPYSDSSRNESWYSLIYNKFCKGAEMTLFFYT